MKKLIISLITGLFVLTIVAQEAEKTFTLENTVRKNEFGAKRIAGLKPMADGRHYCMNEGGNILKYAYETGELVDTLIRRSDLLPEGSESPIYPGRYTFSRDERKVLIPTQTERIYRWSSRSEYYIFNLEDNTLTPLSANGKQRLADFSPDGTQVAFVRDNNIFIKDLAGGRETRITDDGRDRHMINGTTDWVYEEEFGFIKGFHWSPDGSRIAYYKFDESGVKEYEMQMWGELYPGMYRYKYPKAGEDNSIVSIHIYELASGRTITVDTGDETDQYLPRMQWSGRDDMIAIQRMNRLQNKLEILLAEVAGGKSEVIYTEENKYYIDITDDLTFTDEDHFLITSEKDGYNHIYYHDIPGNSAVQLTKGPWDVTSMLGYDAGRERVLFEAASSSPLNRDLMAVDLDGNISTLSQRQGTNNATFSANYDYCINVFSDANTPPFTTLTDHRGNTLRVLEDNAGLVEKLEEHGYREREFFSIPAAEGLLLNAWRIVPGDFDPGKEYPLLMYVYGGPGSQTVLNSWGGGQLWYQMLAQQGIVCVSVDNRGTGARGEEFKKMTYLQLGKYETIDQIAAARYLAGQPWADEDRIGVFGWSYGGFMASLCMTKGADIFDVGIAVAPVTNWKYYDNIYTERFMRTPKENPGGYEDNSPINFTDQLEGKYLLVHGTADDNVHVQNSIDLITALVESDKQFDLQIYPNKNHGIYGGNTRFHLFTRLSDFLLENLK
jgi:dipeptidyl-peptidase-4